MSLSSYTTGSPIRKTTINRPSIDSNETETKSHDTKDGPVLDTVVPLQSSKPVESHKNTKKATESRPMPESDSSPELSDPPSELSPPPCIAKDASPTGQPSSNPLSPSVSDGDAIVPVRRTRAGRIVGRKRDPLSSSPTTKPVSKLRSAARTSAAGSKNPSAVSKRKSTKNRRSYILKPGSLFLTQPTPPPVSPLTPPRAAKPHSKCPLPEAFYYTTEAILRAELIQPRGCATTIDAFAALADKVIPEGTSRLLASEAATQALIDVTERVTHVTEALAARKPAMALRDFPCPPAMWSPVQRNGKISYFKAAVSVAHVGSVDGDYGLGALLREYDYRLREVEGMVFAGKGSVEVGFLEEVVGRLEEQLGVRKE